MTKRFDDLDLVNVISCSCYISGCENKASNKHLRGDYIVYFCEDHNPNYPELELK